MRQSFVKQRGDANTRTRQLFALYALAILLTLIAYNVLIYACFYIFNSPLINNGLKSVAQADLTAKSPVILQVMLWFSIIYCIILIGIYLYHYQGLKNNPQALIYQLSRCYDLDKPRNFKEKQLINITEEMSVASGQPVPKLYLLINEQSINAFTFGFAKQGYGIGVTQGALDYLTRAELQALLAHEFGHIVSDDVGINMRLSSILQSFFVIASLKEKFLDSQREYSGGFGYADGRGLAIFAIIYLFYCVSLVMVSAGQALQGFISRTREVHADACAVQFTRQQDSLVSLLQKIYALQYYSSVGSHSLPKSFQHMQFFGLDRAKTHPPIAERIKAYGGETALSYIEGLYYQLKSTKDIETDELTKSLQQHDKETFSRLLTTPIMLPIISNMLNNQSDYRYDNLNLSKALEQLTAILITIENLEVDDVKSHCQSLNLDLVKIVEIQSQLRRQSHPLYWIKRCQDIANHLFGQTDNEKKLIIDFLNKLVKVDGKISIHEFSYLVIINNALKASVNNGNATLNDVQQAIHYSLNYLASLNKQQNPTAVFTYLYEKLYPNSVAVQYQTPEASWQTTLYRSMNELKTLRKSDAQQLLNLLTDTLLGDNQINVAQYNLLYAIADCTGIPFSLKQNS